MHDMDSKAAQVLGTPQLLPCEDILKNLRCRINDIWQDDPENIDVVMIPALCNICFTSELLQERFSTETAADILAGISICDTRGSSEKSVENLLDRSMDGINDDFFDCDVFKLRQECSMESNKTHNVDFSTDNNFIVPEFASYSQPFDPCLTFPGLHKTAFPDSCNRPRNKDFENNICLSVDVVDRNLNYCLTRYNNYLEDLQISPGGWIDNADHCLPQKFTSYEHWLNDKNAIKVEDEIDINSRHLAAQISSDSIKRLWSDGSSCTPSLSDEQESYSRQGYFEDTPSNGGSYSAPQCGMGNDDGYSDFCHYQEVHSDSSGQEETISPLWSGRDINSFKDFVPRVSYGFNLPVPEDGIEYADNDDMEKLCDAEDTMEMSTESKFFNIWCPSGQIEGQGDSADNNFTDRCSSPPSLHYGNTMSNDAMRTPQDIGHQIPRLVTNKRKERPMRGYKNVRRSNIKDYQVTFVNNNGSVNLHCPSRDVMPTALSDTTVWRMKGLYNDIAVVDGKHGISKSETHQEYLQQSRRTRADYPIVEKVELSAQSEPFFPKGASPRRYGSQLHGQSLLYQLDEEVIRSKLQDSPREGMEIKTNLSPTSLPFVPRAAHKHHAGHQHAIEDELEEDEYYFDSPCMITLDEHDKDELSINLPEPEPVRLAEPRKTSMMETYLNRFSQRTPSTDTTNEYKLFQDVKNNFYDNNVLKTEDSEQVLVKAKSKQCGQIGNMRFTEHGWERITEPDTNIWPQAPVSKYEARPSQLIIQPSRSNHSTCQSPIAFPSHHSVRSLQSIRQSSSQQSFITAPELSSSQGQLTRSHGLESLLQTPQHSSHSILDRPEHIELPCFVHPRDVGCIEFKPTTEMIPPGIPMEGRRMQHRAVPSQWVKCERPPSIHQLHDPSRQLQSIAGQPPLSSIMHNPVTLVPAHAYEAPYQQMVLLQPEPPRLVPRAFAAQTAAFKPTYLRPALAPTLQRFPLEHSRLQASLIARPNAIYATHAGFATAVPGPAYRHVTVATPKFVAVPTFEPPAARFYTSYMNVNNHNDAYSSDSEMSEASFDFLGFLDDESEHYEVHSKARPIRANPANLVHLT